MGFGSNLNAGEAYYRVTYFRQAASAFRTPDGIRLGELTLPGLKSNVTITLAGRTDGWETLPYKVAKIHKASGNSVTVIANNGEKKGKGSSIPALAKTAKNTRRKKPAVESSEDNDPVPAKIAKSTKRKKPAPIDPPPLVFFFFSSSEYGTRSNRC